MSYWHNLILVISQLVIMCLHHFKQVNSNWLSIISKVTSCISSLPVPVEKADSYYFSLMLQDSKQIKREVILKHWLISDLSVLWYKNVLLRKTVHNKDKGSPHSGQSWCRAATCSAKWIEWTCLICWNLEF